MDKHVLVIDDDGEIRSVLQELLESEGYVVDTASDGRIALDKIAHQQARYEAILLDLVLPGMNGLQLVQLLQQREEVCLRSILVLSADSDALRQATRLDVCQCLAKPFDLEMVLNFVRSRKKQHL